MGKITRKDATDLVEKGILSEKHLKQMEDQNLVSKRGNTSERYMKSKDGKWTSPTLYFKGLKKDGKYTKEMTNLKKMINEMIRQHTITKSEMNSKGAIQ